MSLWRQLTRAFATWPIVTRPITTWRTRCNTMGEGTAAGIARGLLLPARRAVPAPGSRQRTAVRKQCETYGWENLVGTTLADIRYATRRLANRPDFPVVAVVTLGTRRRCQCRDLQHHEPDPVRGTSLPAGQSCRHACRISAPAMAPSTSRSARMWRGGNPDPLVQPNSPSQRLAAGPRPDRPKPSPERLQGQQVRGTISALSGVLPAIGRDFQPADDLVGGPSGGDRRARGWRDSGSVTVIASSARRSCGWRSRTVIVVMPPSFENVIARRRDVWAPSAIQPDRIVPSSRVGTSPADAGTAQAWRDARRGAARNGCDRTVAARGVCTTAVGEPGGGMIITSLQDAMARDVKPVLLAIVGGVLLLLAIASVNVINLLLARGALRRGEIAVRTALGAGRTRLVRQVLTESLVLAALGGALGLFLAQAGVRALVLLAPAGLPRLGAIRLDSAVFAFAALLITCTGVVVGLIPALQVARPDPAAGLQQGSRRTTGGHHATRGVLVVTEIALAVVLLTGAGLLWRSIHRLLGVAPGFDASHMLSMQVHASGHRYDPDSARYRFFEQARDAVLRVPGVAAAAFTSQLPLSGDFETYGVQFEARPDQTPQDAAAAFRYVVTPGYFQAMRIPLRHGRLFDAHDDRGAPEAVIVNESYAKRVFGDGDPVGQRVRAGPEIGNATRPWDVIVGVVGNVKQASLAVAEPDAFYIPSGQWSWVDNVQSLVVRTSVDAKTLAPAIRNAIWSVDRQPITRVTTMDNLLKASEASRHFALVVFEAFALTALTLAAIGIYGILSGSVTERTREIGVRSALGASRGDILGLVVRQGMVLTGLGVVIGVAGAVAASRAVATLLFGVSRFDPVTYVAVVGVLVGVSGVACWMPAWRAAKVDPVITLRAE